MQLHFIAQIPFFGGGVINLATERRHLVLTLRKRHICKCGCRGWCSYWAAFDFTAWLIESVASGVYPTVRHDGSSWAEDSLDASVAGSSMGFSGVVIVVKNDWAEYAHSLGFPTWGHHAHPCFSCFCRGGAAGNMAQTQGITLRRLPWRLKTEVEYMDACAKCEIPVRVASRDKLRKLVAALFYDRRQGGSHGRVVGRDFSEYNIIKGDRLEPSAGCPDIGMVDTMCQDFPEDGVSLVFVRVSSETLTRHRNPLFHARTGLTPQMCAVDELHTVHLGLVQDYVAASMWRLILANVWDVAGSTPNEVRQVAAVRLHSDLFSWYRRQKQENPDRPIYEVPDLSLAHLVTPEKPILRAKAAQSGSLLLFFAVHMVGRFVDRLDRGSELLAAGRALEQYMEIARDSPLRLSPEDRKRLLHNALGFLNVREAAGIPYKPQMHLFVHLAHTAGLFGNPRLLGNWIDEGLNMRLAQVCRTAHAAVWSRRVLATFAHESGPAAKAVKKRRKRL